MPAEKEVDRMLKLLREKIRDQGFTQLKVQEALGWGRTYISQLFRKQKSLRFDQILLIIQVIGIPASDFFAEFYGLTQPEDEGGFYYYSYPRGFGRPKPVPAMRVPSAIDAEKLNELNSTVTALKRALVDKGVLEAAEIEAAVKPSGS